MDFPIFHLDLLGNRMLIAITAISMANAAVNLRKIERLAKNDIYPSGSCGNSCSPDPALA